MMHGNDRVGLLSACALALAGCVVSVVGGGGGGDAGGAATGGGAGLSSSGRGATSTATATSGQGGASSTTTATSASTSTSAGVGGGMGCAPATIVGIDMSGPSHHVARLDPATGVLTTLGPAPAGGLLSGLSAYDHATRRIYQVGEGVLYAVDGLTGAVLYTTAISQATANDIVNPRVNDAGEIIMLRSGTPWTVARLDPTTATITDLGPSPYDGGYGDAQRAFDPVTNRMYQLGESFVLTLDGATGAVLANTSLADDSFFNPTVNDAGQLLGVRSDGGGGFHVARLDPTTAIITDLAVLPAPAGILDGIGTYDPCTNRIYQVSGQELLTLDGTTGALLAEVAMTQQNFVNFEAVW